MPVDVVITDLRMSAVADGLELARYVLAHCPGVALVLASAQAPPLTEDLTFDAFFIKPYPPEDLVAWIRRRQLPARPRLCKFFSGRPSRSISRKGAIITG
jgi:CheY-like chemotaxis protein